MGTRRAAQYQWSFRKYTIRPQRGTMTQEWLKKTHIKKKILKQQQNTELPPDSGKVPARVCRKWGPLHCWRQARWSGHSGEHTAVFSGVEQHLTMRPVTPLPGSTDTETWKRLPSKTHAHMTIEALRITPDCKQALVPFTWKWIPWPVRTGQCFSA